MEPVAPNFDSLFGDPERAQTAAEVDETIKILEGIVNADLRNLYTGKNDERGLPVMLNPKRWPDAETKAVSSITPSAAGLKLQFVDRTRAIEQLAKLKGMYRNEESAANPLETAFARLPREDLLKLAEVLQHLVKSATSEPA